MSDDPAQRSDPRPDPALPGEAARSGSEASQGVFGPGFGLATEARQSWVPERSGSPGAQQQGQDDGTASGPPGVAGPLGAAYGPHRTAGRGRGSARGTAAPSVRVRPWQIVAVTLGALIPVVLWIVNSVGSRPGTADDLGLGRRPVVLAPQPTTPGGPTLVQPTFSVTGTVVAPPTPYRSQPSRLPMPSPPTLLAGPSVAVTPVPQAARTIRFEANAAGGAVVEVSLSDATHLAHSWPAQRPPVAFEIPVPATVASSDYFSLRVRTPSGPSTDRPDVTCRILVDGVVITSQQGWGYATCYVSPYYDLRRT